MAVTCTIRPLSRDAGAVSGANEDNATATPSKIPVVLPQPFTLTFDQPRVVIGRGTHADVRLPSRAVSSTHAVLRADHGELSIIDESSSNGTLVNGALLVRGRKKILRDGDRVTVPGYELLLTVSTAIADLPERTATIARKLLAEAMLLAGSEGSPPTLRLVPLRESASGRGATPHRGQNHTPEWVFLAPPSRLVAGRGDNCEILLDDPDCSRHHAEFVRDDLGVLVRDLGSKNGVLVGGRRWPERRLRDGDEVQLGRVVLAYSDPAEALLRAFELGSDESKPLEAQRPSTIPPPSMSLGQAESASAPSGPSAANVQANDSQNANADRGLKQDPALPSSASSAEVALAPTGVAEPSQDFYPAKEKTKPGVSTASTSATRRAKKTRTLDWVVALLAMLILAASVMALVLVLKPR